MAVGKIEITETTGVEDAWERRQARIAAAMTPVRPAMYVAKTEPRPGARDPLTQTMWGGAMVRAMADRAA